MKCLAVALLFLSADCWALPQHAGEKALPSDADPVALLKEGFRVLTERQKAAEKPAKQTKRRRSLVRTVSGENSDELPIPLSSPAEPDSDDSDPSAVLLSPFEAQQIQLQHGEEQDPAGEPHSQEPVLEEAYRVPAELTSLASRKTSSSLAATGEAYRVPVLLSSLVSAAATATALKPGVVSRPLPVSTETLVLHHTPAPTTPTVVTLAAAASSAGWVTSYYGAAHAEQKNAPPAKQPGNLVQEDALPDAMAVISNLWEHGVDIVTETMFVTSRYHRTPTPTLKAAASVGTTTKLKKYEKGKPKATTTSQYKLNTNLIKGDIPFSIAPGDIFRGVHASDAVRPATSMLLILSFTILLVLCM